MYVDDDDWAEAMAAHEARKAAEAAKEAADRAALVGEHILADGRILYVNPLTLVAEFLTCSWLIQVPSGNPEPDSVADCWRERDCGLTVTCLERTGKPLSTEHTTCLGGHDWHAYGTAENTLAELEAERYDRTHGF